MNHRYVVEEGYFGVWEPFKSFRFYGTANRYARKQEEMFGVYLFYRVIDSKTGEIV